MISESRFDEVPIPGRIEEALEEFLQLRGMIDIDDWLHRYPDCMSELLEFLGNEAQFTNLIGPMRSANPLPSCQIGAYKLIDIIDRGGMGIVYKAVDTRVNRVVALKMIHSGQHSSPEARQRFRNEAETASRLEHPNLVSIFEVGEHNGVPFFSMEFVQGRNLAELRRQGKILPKAIARVTRTIAETIQYIHGQSVIHRDLKPSNIMLTERFEVRVTDFGLAKRLDCGEKLTTTGQILGTINYMPPEQADARHDKVDETSDIYSIGAVMYEMLTGHPPFSGTSFLDTLRKIREDKPVPPRIYNAAVPASLEAICLRCLEKTPSKRYSSAGELAEELGAFLEDEHFVPASMRPRMWSLRSRIPMFLGSGVFGLLLFAGISASGLLDDMFLKSNRNNLVAQLPAPTSPKAAEKAQQTQKTTTDTPVDEPLIQANSEPSTGGDPAPSDPPTVIVKSTEEPGPKIPDLPESTITEAPAQQLAEPELLVQKEQPVARNEAEDLPPIRIVSAISSDGDPLGVGEISIDVIPNAVPGFHKDIPIRLTASEGKPLYASAVLPTKSTVANRTTPDRIVLRFVYSQKPPRDIRVTYGDEVLAEHIDLLPEPDRTRHRVLLIDWWTNFARFSLPQTSAELVSLNRSFLEILGKRLGLAVPPDLSNVKSSSPMETMKSEFERSVGMLFGFESVRLAMMADQAAAEVNAFEDANRPLPTALQIRSVPLPRDRVEAPAEAIAMRVPQECFYLRCREVATYSWIRQLVKGWGGNLEAIVATPAVDRQVREKLELQLALNTGRLIEVGVDQHISDCALIGMDPLFHEGAAIGVLFETTNGGAVGRIIDAERATVAETHRCKESSTNILNTPVRQLLSEHGQIRSFYVVSQNYHLITNSETLVRRFLETQSGKTSLGSLAEYRYAKSELKDDSNCLAWLYMSDPFFRNITSPTFRIEMMRRRRSAEELLTLAAAQMAATAEGIIDHSVESLTNHKFLPQRFGKRPDGSRLLLSNGRPIDSMRGVCGTFTPVADMNVSSCTDSERIAYEQFRAQYREQWPSMDPVLLTFSRNSSDEVGTESVTLNIRITPYAQKEYRVLRQNLWSEPLRERAAMRPDQLLGVSGQLNSDNQPLWMQLGLIDADVDYEIRDGQIVRTGPQQHLSWGKSHSFAAVGKGGSGGTWQLKTMIADLQGKQYPEDAQPNRNNHQTPTNPGGLLGVFVQILSSPSSVIDSILLSYMKSADNVTVLAFDNELRESLLRNSETEATDRPAQLFMELRDVSAARVFPYINATTYLSSRRASASDAAMVNHITDMLCVDDPQQTRTEIEQAICATLACPTGGNYRLAETKNRTGYWVSTSWQKPSAELEESVPADYEFPFLAWLQSMQLECSLTRTTLHSRLDLKVRIPELNNLQPKSVSTQK
ncbi:MAG: serine/threonine protein kinase [Planctomyces sp.]|nr:serine/threonine protein kinase [Planctomyces sp.]